MPPRIRVLSFAIVATLVGVGIWYGTRDSNPQAGGAATSLEPSARGAHATATPTASNPRSGSSASALESPANRLVRVRHLSGRAYVVDDFGRVPSGTIDKVIAELSPLAMAGDATASYGIFLKLNECANINRRASRGVALQAAPDVAAACNDLSAEHEVSSSKWLSLAAEQGNIGARLLYAADSESALGGPAELLRNPDRAKEYKQTAVGYLQEMASQGSADALLQLGNAYHAGVLIDEDLVASRAYFEAVRLVDPSIVPARQVSTLDKSLSGEQLSLALRKGNQIYDSCCR
ncbi:TPR repeat [Stenotrophomonas sp. CC120222-04]|nr:TPR repeat [Stenotrophomonas sp. CC120222-04]